MNKRLFRAVFAVFAGLSVLAAPLSRPVGAKAISAKAYALVEQSTGRVLLSGNGELRLPMASTTKIMTALLAVESGKLDESYTVPAEALKVEGSSMGLVPDERITLRELVYGLMLESGNDAANAIAFMLGGSTERFAAMMNDRAHRLGLDNTHFTNPSGLYNADHYTTAIDLAHLAAYAMKDPEFAKIVGTKSVAITYNGIKNGRTLVNHNRLLRDYAGALGVKTGFTKKSGRCLVSCAARDGVELVAVTLGDPDDWKDHAELLDSGFKLLKSTPLYFPAQHFSADVVGGVKDKVEAVCDGDATASLEPGDRARLKLVVELERFYYAPIEKGDTLGRVVYSLDGSTVATVDIKAAESVNAQYMPPADSKPHTGFFSRLWQSIAGFFSRLFNKPA